MTRKEAIEWQHRLFENGPHSDLLSICMDLRWGVNGSGDEWEPKKIQEVLNMLRARLETWDRRSLPCSSWFDSSVYTLVEATIYEVNSHTWWKENLND